MITFLVAAVSKLPKVSTPAAVVPTPQTVVATAESIVKEGTRAGLNFNQLVFYFFNFLFFVYVVFLWALLFNWVGKDSRRRGLSDQSRRVYQVLVLVFTLPGLLLYFLTRPRLTLAEKERLEMEEELLRLELEKLRREVK